MTTARDVSTTFESEVAALDIEPIRALFNERNRTWIARKAHGSTGDKRLLKDAKQRLRTQSLMLNAEVPKLLAEIDRLRSLARAVADRVRREARVCTKCRSSFGVVTEQNCEACSGTGIAWGKA